MNKYLPSTLEGQHPVVSSTTDHKAAVHAPGLFQLLVPRSLLNRCKNTKVLEQGKVNLFNFHHLLYLWRGPKL